MKNKEQQAEKDRLFQEALDNMWTKDEVEEMKRRDEMEEMFKDMGYKENNGKLSYLPSSRLSLWCSRL